MAGTKEESVGLMPTEKFVIDNIIEKEKIRNQEMRLAYEQRLSGFPRGSLTIRESKGRKYCYFKYRDGKKIITKYAGTEKMISELQEQIEERDRLAEMIRMLDAEYEKIEKLENIR